jgi:hypothetical protein
MDSNLANEAEALAGDDIHDVRAVITNYACYARWLVKPPVRCGGTEPLVSQAYVETEFDKCERILRAFVGRRRTGEMPSICQIKKELAEDGK